MNGIGQCHTAKDAGTAEPSEQSHGFIQRHGTSNYGAHGVEIDIV